MPGGSRWGTAVLAYGSEQLQKLQRYAAGEYALPGCIRALPDEQFFFGEGHVECWIRWLASTMNDAECLLVLFTNRNVRSQDDEIVASLCADHPHVKLTILPVEKNRFPALGLSALADLCTSLSHWLDRSSKLPKFVYLGGAKNSSRPLFLYLALRSWRRGESVSLAEGLRDLEIQDEKLEGDRSILHNSLHRGSSCSPSQLFASQLRLLTHWYALNERFRMDFTPSGVEVRPFRILGFTLNITGLSEAAVNNSHPIVEVFLGHHALWSSKPAHSIAWAAMSPSDVTVLKLNSGPVHRKPDSALWNSSVLNAPKITGDFMIRLLPVRASAQESAVDSLFGLEARSADVPAWMLRVQSHASIYTEASELVFQNDELDGWDLILKSMEQRDGLKRSEDIRLDVSLTLQIEWANEVKVSPALEMIRTKVQSSP